MVNADFSARAGPALSLAPVRLLEFKEGVRPSPAPISGAGEVASYLLGAISPAVPLAGSSVWAVGPVLRPLSAADVPKVTLFGSSVDCLDLPFLWPFSHGFLAFGSWRRSKRQRDVSILAVPEYQEVHRVTHGATDDLLAELLRRRDRRTDHGDDEISALRAAP